MNEELIRNVAEIAAMSSVMLATAFLLIFLVMKWWYTRGEK